jgi:hypothetical protein
MAATGISEVCQSSPLSRFSVFFWRDDPIIRGPLESSLPPFPRGSLRYPESYLTAATAPCRAKHNCVDDAYCIQSHHVARLNFSNILSAGFMGLPMKFLARIFLARLTEAVFAITTRWEYPRAQHSPPNGNLEGSVPTVARVTLRDGFVRGPRLILVFEILRP